MPDPVHVIVPAPPRAESAPDFMWLAQELLRRMDIAEERAAEQRAEQTAAIRELSAELRKHMEGEEARDAKLLEALLARDAGAEKAMRDLAAEKSWPRRAAEGAAREAWAMFKVPVAGLVTAACAWYGWAYFQIPTTPTAVPVVVTGASSGNAAAAVPAAPKE